MLLRTTGTYFDMVCSMSSSWAQAHLALRRSRRPTGLEPEQSPWFHESETGGYSSCTRVAGLHFIKCKAISPADSKLTQSDEHFIRDHHIEGICLTGSLHTSPRRPLLRPRAVGPCGHAHEILDPSQQAVAVLDAFHSSVLSYCFSSALFWQLEQFMSSAGQCSLLSDAAAMIPGVCRWYPRG